MTWKLAALLAPTLIACSSPSNDGLYSDDGSGDGSEMTGVATLEQKSDVPSCSWFSLGEVYYVKRTKELLYCDGKKLKPIDIKEPYGHWLTEIKSASYEECANGGIKILVGIDKNDNGYLKGNEILDVGIVCNGEDGEDGEDGSSCTVVASDAGSATITCEDGTSATIFDGKDGADGAPGATGADGAPGATGATGADGAPGATGATGADGAPGATGADGAPGATGATGADGAPGATGATGADGAPGATGATGADGAPGATGATGPTGPTGAGCSVSGPDANNVVIITCGEGEGATVAVVSFDIALETTQLDTLNAVCGLGGTVLAVGIDSDNDGDIDVPGDAANICPLPPILP